MSDQPVEVPMNLNKDIFAYGMTQLPVASSRVNPYDPYLKWSREVAQLQADGEALVRYVRAKNNEDRTFAERNIAEDEYEWSRAVDERREAWQALSQELRDAISKESSDEAEI